MLTMFFYTVYSYGIYDRTTLFMDNEALRAAKSPVLSQGFGALEELVKAKFGVDVGVDGGRIVPLDSYCDKNFLVEGQYEGKLRKFNLKLLNGFDSQNRPLLAFHQLVVNQINEQFQLLQRTEDATEDTQEDIYLCPVNVLSLDQQGVVYEDMEVEEAMVLQLPTSPTKQLVKPLPQLLPKMVPLGPQLTQLPSKSLTRHPLLLSKPNRLQLRNTVRQLRLPMQLRQLSLLLLPNPPKQQNQLRPSQLPKPLSSGPNNKLRISHKQQPLQEPRQHKLLKLSPLLGLLTTAKQPWPGKHNKLPMPSPNNRAWPSTTSTLLKAPPPGPHLLPRRLLQGPRVLAMVDSDNPAVVAMVATKNMEK